MFLMSRKQNRTLPGGRFDTISFLVSGAFALIFAFGAGTTTLAATAGSVDISFGVAGKAITQFPNAATATAVAVQADRKVVVAGGSPGFSVARYNADGTPDTTFGTNGIAFTVLGPSTNFAHALLIQPDGKIVLAGESGLSNPDHGMTLVRFTAAGVLDTTFSGDGVASIEVGTIKSIAYGVTIQPDGSLVVAGQTQLNATDVDVAIARFTAAGVLDTTFGVSGVIQEHTSVRSFAYAITSFGDGRFIVAGTTYVGPFNTSYDDLDFLIYRYNANGTRDNTFGTGGRVITTIGGGPDVINAITFQPNGRIVVAGYALSDTIDMVVARYTLNGVLDAGQFGSSGKVLIDFGTSNDIAYGIKIDSNMEFVIAGVTEAIPGTAQDLALARLTSGGDLDPNFGTNGKARHNLGGPVEFSTGLALQPNLLHGVVNGYKIITTGRMDDFAGKFATVRFHGRSGPIQRAAVNDFDDDGQSELALFRPPTGDWIIGKLPPAGSVTQVTTIHWGANGDKVVPGDYDGDGKYDLAVYRAGIWHILTSGGKYLVYTFGLASDIPVPADYDGDSRTDVAVFRPSNGVWYWIRSSDQTFTAGQWGANGDIPVVGDYDRDDRADLAVFRAGVWYILQSGTNQLRVEYFGLSTDKPVPFDYDGDSVTDIGVFRAGLWYYITSDNGAFHAVSWGNLTTDIPLPGRYGTPSGLAYYRDGQFRLNEFGTAWIVTPNGDIPVPTYFAQ